MVVLVSEQTGPDGPDERALFEKAQSKLNEAFTLLQTLEGELQKTEQRRQVRYSAHDKYASERAELRAYVERVHAEAAELCVKPVRAGREGRDLVRRVTMRIEEVTRVLQRELPVEVTPTVERLPRDITSNGDGMAEHLSRIIAATQIVEPRPVLELAEDYDDEVTPLLPNTKRETVLADLLSSEWVKARRHTTSGAPASEMLRAVGMSRKPQIRSVMFDPNGRDERVEAQVEENTAHLSRERQGAQMRRDPRPTELDQDIRKTLTILRKPQFVWTVASVCLLCAVILLVIGLRG
ncbi:MAG: hypothetical protein H7Z43_01505 [Clostridia bacterium]|nr:hypothetical protein [Deltaproteobacteria bacterium]